MSRYFIEVSYKGTNYAGFQVQKNAPTIQSEVEKALAIGLKQSFNLTGSSRTDAGVHALQNYFHFDAADNIFSLNKNLNEEENAERILYSLNSILPEDIVIKKISKMGAADHCRFNALSREYKYFIYFKKNPFYKDIAYFYPYKIDIEKLHISASIILNTKDFISFSKRNTQVNNFICSIFKSEWGYENDFLVYNVAGNRFLRGMVKGLVGTMLKMASGKISLEEFNEVITNDNNTKTDFPVPSKGLFLISVKYSLL